VAVDDIAAAMGTARALNRVLLVDAAPSAVWLGGKPKERSEFALRGAVERWSRSHGVHALVVVGSDRVAERPASNRGLLVPSLREAAGENAVDADDWLSAAAERATAASQKLAGARQDVQASSRSKGFPLLAAEK
jgi:hypothetical protein